MGKEQWDEFKKVLLEQKKKILNGGILRSQEDLTIASEDLPDEADVANSVINQQVSFSMREREINKLRAIDEALARIEDGTYGTCEDCGDPIDIKRLRVQPWTTLCIEHAEERERDSQIKRFA